MRALFLKREQTDERPRVAKDRPGTKRRARSAIILPNGRKFLLLASCVNPERPVL